MILEYRQLAKLTGAYADALPALVHPRTGRIHTSFNQLVAATGPRAPRVMRPGCHAAPHRLSSKLSRMADGALRFTVFTPTHNHGAVLHRVYECLCRQTLGDFEWLVVDDGSADDTGRRVAGWLSRACFPLRYDVQLHAGKHVAFNRGVRQARGEFFVVADADDEFVPEALARLLHHWEMIPSDQRARFVGVTALCRDESGALVGTPFPHSPTDSDALEIRYRHKVRGEKWGFQRTDVLRRFPFPEAPAMLFVPESVVWDRIARHYRTRYVNECLRTYHRDAVPGLSRRVDRAVAPGRMLYYQQVLNEQTDWLARAPGAFARAAIQYARYATLAGASPAAQLAGLKPRRARLLWGAAWPVARCLATRDLHRAHEPTSRG